MSRKSITVKIVGQSTDQITVRLPFLDVPVTMNRSFFERRVRCGYFQLEDQAALFEPAGS